MAFRLSSLAKGLIAPGLAAIVLAACSGTQEIALRQMMAPENMELAMRGDVAVVEFTGEGGQEVAELLSAGLERVRVKGRPVFEVHGPVRLHSGRSAAIGNVDPAEALDFARSVDARAVLTGQISYGSSTELLPPETSETCETRDAAGTCIAFSTVIRQCAEIIVTIGFTTQAMDAVTGEMIYEAAPRRAVRSATECESRRDDFQGELIAFLMGSDFEHVVERLQPQLAQTAADLIHRDISPYPEIFHISFLTEGDRLAEAQQANFEQGSDLIDRGKLEAGCSVWERMAQSGVRDPAVAFNLAACAESAGHFQDAIEAYGSVYRMVFHTPLQATAEGAEPTRDLEEWSDLLSKAQERVRRRQDSSEALGTLSGLPSS